MKSIKYYVLSIKEETKSIGLRKILLNKYYLILISLFLITYYLLLSASGAFAQSPSPGSAQKAASPSAKTQDESPQATKSATDEVRERVRQKIENLVKKPRAVVGTLSEVTDSTLQITNRVGKEDMVATTKDTQYVRVAANKRTNIKFEDLVIGDFILAMGYKNGNNILEARRVIAYDKSPITQRRAVYGIVKENTRGTLTVEHPKTKEVWTITTDKKTVITKKTDGKTAEVDIKDVQVGDRVTSAGILDPKKEKILVARRIHVIPGKAQGLVDTPKPTKSPSPTPKSTSSPSQTE